MSEERATILDLGLENVPELTLADEGEHEIQCVKAEIKPAKSGDGNVIHLYHKVLDQENTKIVRDWIVYGRDADDDDQANNRLRDIKKMVTAFGGDFTGTLDLEEEVVGNTAWAYIRIDEPGEGFEADGDVNRISYYINR